MSTALAIYAALGVTMGALLLRGQKEGRLRWYNVAFSVACWPVVIIGGAAVARRLIRLDLERGALGGITVDEVRFLRAHLHELPFKLRLQVQGFLVFERILRWAVGA